MVKLQLSNKQAEFLVIGLMLALLAAMAIPLTIIYLSGAKQRAFDADRARIQFAIERFYNEPDNPRSLGERQYPIIALRQEFVSLVKGNDVLAFNDNQNPFNPYIGGIPLALDIRSQMRGTQGADISSSWKDLGTKKGVREIGHSDNADSWLSIIVNRNGTTYQLDPRNVFIDFELLIEGGWLDEVPQSVSMDNQVAIERKAYSGSYIWYVDEFGIAEAMYAVLPSVTGYVDGVFP